MKTAIRFHTNLDLAQPYLSLDCGYSHMGELWDHVPAVGSRIRFPLPIEPRGSHFELEVCGVTYDRAGTSVTVELHLPSWWRASIKEWEDQFRNRLRGTT